MPQVLFLFVQSCLSEKNLGLIRRTSHRRM